MNQIMLYHIWKRVVNEETDDDDKVIRTWITYELVESRTSLDEAQELTQGSNGTMVYTWSEAWYGESGV